MKKVFYLLFIPFSLCLLVVALPIVLGLFMRDTEPTEDGDLLYQQIEVADADNAYFDLKKIEESLKLAEEDSQRIQSHLNGEEWDQGFVENVLFSNEAALEYFDTASEKSAYQEPAYADFSSITLKSLIPTVKGLAAATRLNALDALSLAAQGEEEKAFEKLFKSLDLAQTLQSAQGTLIHQLVVVTSKKISVSALQRLAEKSTLPEDQLQAYAQRLGSYESLGGFIQGLKGEYFLDSWVVDYASNENFESLGLDTPLPLTWVLSLGYNFYFHPNETKLMFANYTREGIENLPLCENPPDPANSFEFLQNKPLYQLYFTKNAVGEMLFLSLAYNQDGVIRQNCEFQELLEATQKLLSSPYSSR